MDNSNVQLELLPPILSNKTHFQTTINNDYSFEWYSVKILDIMRETRFLRLEQFLSKLNRIILTRVVHPSYWRHILPLDINECTSGVAGCSQDCINKEGGFNCNCEFGYTLDDDRKTCVVGKLKIATIIIQLYSFKMRKYVENICCALL